MWRCSPRTPSPPTSAGSSACSTASSSRPTWASSTGPIARAAAPLRGAHRTRALVRVARRPTGAPHARAARAGRSARLPALELVGRRGFFTDANACVARAAWERVPFREVAYAEDRVLAIDMLRAGYAKVFVPDGGRAPLPRLRRPARSCAAASTSGAGCARSTAGASPRLARAARCGGCAASSAHARARAGRRAARRAPARRRRSRPSPSQCASHGRRPARLAGRPAARRRPAPRSRSSAARASPRSTSTHSPAPSHEEPDRDQEQRPASRDAGRPDRLAGDDRGRRARRRTQRPLAGPAHGAIYLTIEYHGWRTLLFRVVTFPLRFTPLQTAPAAALAHRRRRLRARAGLVSRATAGRSTS